MAPSTTPGQTLGYWKASSPGAGPTAGSGAGKKTAGGPSGKRIVRTAAGARRYHVPIGAEIKVAAPGTKAAGAQRNKPATQRYNALVGQNRAAQSKYMQKLNRTQLTRLTAVANSFDSKDPNVARLRAGLSAELKRRGIDADSYLQAVGIRKDTGKGSSFKFPGNAKGNKGPAPKPKPKVVAKPKPGGRAKGSSGAATPVRKARPPLKRKVVKPAVSGMKARSGDRRLTQLSNVAQLRTALGAFGKVAPQHRQAAARWLVTQAVELSAIHILGRTVVEASNIEPDSALGQRVIELAGRWKHGYIPLDATAMRAKMKGGNGKPWWFGGKQKRRGNKESMRKSIVAGRGHRAEKAPRPKSSGDGPAKQVHGGASRTNVVKSGGTTSPGGTKMNTTPAPKPITEPFPGAANFLEMHGTVKTREKLDALKARKSRTNRPNQTLNLQISGLENVLARGNGSNELGSTKPAAAAPALTARQIAARDLVESRGVEYAEQRLEEIRRRKGSNVARNNQISALTAAIAAHKAKK